MAVNQPLKNRVITTSFPEITAPLRALTDEEFETRALRLFAFQFENNHAYRRLCESRRLDPRTVAKWQDVPAVPTAAFKEFEISCLAPDDRTTVFHSSGTTEHRPSRHFHNAASLAIYEESLLSSFTQNVSNGRPVCVLALTPPIQQAPHSSLVHMFETVARSRRREEAGGTDCDSDPPPHVGGYVFLGDVYTAGDWILDLNKTVSCLETFCSQQQAVCILGTAFLFVHLVDHLRERWLRFKLPAGSLLMETGGYKGRSRSIPRSELHAMICDAFGVGAEQIVCEYGMSELSSQAYAKLQDGGACRAATSRAPFRRALERGSPDPQQNPCAWRGSEVWNSYSAFASAAAEASRAPESGEQRRIFHFPGWCRVQIISPETGKEAAEGETGLIRVFDLANVYSVMAVQTEDLGIKRGSGFELLGRVALSEPRGCSLMTR